MKSPPREIWPHACNFPSVVNAQYDCATSPWELYVFTTKSEKVKDSIVVAISTYLCASSPFTLCVVNEYGVSNTLSESELVIILWNLLTPSLSESTKREVLGSSKGIIF